MVYKLRRSLVFVSTCQPFNLSTYQPFNCSPSLRDQSTNNYMEKSNHRNFSRRKFITRSGIFLGGSILMKNTFANAFAAIDQTKKINVFAHLWVYASKYPPNWDCTPDLETVFTDLSYSGIDGVELMEVILRHDDAVKKLNELILKYNLPVSGSSYNGNMWDINRHKEILDDIKIIVLRLSRVKGKILCISVGDA